MASKQIESSAKAKKGIVREDEANRPFSRLNFIVMGVSAVLIVLGFLLMFSEHEFHLKIRKSL